MQCIGPIPHLSKPWSRLPAVKHVIKKIQGGTVGTVPGEVELLVLTQQTIIPENLKRFELMSV